MEKERLNKLLKEYANHLTGDDACTDDFLFEGMEFDEATELMDEVQKIILAHLESKDKESTAPNHWDIGG